MKYLIALLISIGAFGACASSPYANGYTFCREITIDHTKVPSTQTNFPVAICIGSGSGSNCSANAKELATIANGGRLLNVNGYDFIITSDNTGNTPIAYERAYQDLTTGDAELWVVVASISSSADTKVYLFYRNSTITTDQASPTSVWDSHFLGVYHFPLKSGFYPVGVNGLLDSTTSSRNFAAPTANTIAATSGVLGGAVDFGSSTDYFEKSTGSYTGMPIGSDPRMLEAWINITTNGMDQPFFCLGQNGSTLRYQMIISSGNVWGIEGGANVFVSFPGSTAAGWHHVVIGLPSGQSTFANSVAYFDGQAKTITNVNNGTLNVDTALSDPSGRDYRIGTLCGVVGGGATFSNSKQDEIRLHDTVRSADWIATEYNNISSPNTFYTLGAESGGAAGRGGPRPIIFR